MQQIPEYSIAELSNKIKYLVESSFATVRVRGEVSGFKVASSGHAYFNIKDDRSILTCTCWRHVINKFRDHIQEGVEIIATGKVTTYAGQSRYQLSVEHIAPAGAGAWMQLFNQLKTKLQQEGLFSEQTKKTIPLLPKKIALVTSSTGSVLHDMVHRIKERCPVHIVIYPVAVQGKDAAAQILSAVQGLNKHMHGDVDLMIIARGGGSIEDLWCFNDEALARGVYASDIPIISAIGHETDFTILDYVADRRAPTPTAAAEMAVPVLSSLREKLSHLTSFLANIVRNKIHSDSNRILQLAPFFARNILSNFEQTLDGLDIALNEVTRKVITKKEQRYLIGQLKASGVMHHVRTKYLLLAEKYSRLCHGIHNTYQSYVQNIEHHSRILESINHKRVLQRGFVLVRSANGTIITDSRAAQNAGQLQLQFNDGVVIAAPHKES